jgi:hypothetical protein
MKFEQSYTELKIRDNPALFWSFYVAFTLGGMICIGITLTQASDWLQGFAGMVIGVGSVAGGLTLISREPASILSFDRVGAKVTVKCWLPLFQRTEIIDINNIHNVDIETSEHTDGGTVYRPRLSLVDGSCVPISLFWYQNAKSSEAVVTAICQFLSLPCIK